MQNQQPLHVASPLRQSLPLTKEAGTAVYLKLDSSQPTGSFKIRGIGHLCQTVGAPGTMSFRPSTGGNAGMAAATLPVRWEVECRATIVVPSLFTPDLTVGASEGPGIVHGQQLVENNPGWVFISPFDDPLIWEGHSSLVKELQQELREKPGAIVLSVGGGGLLNGVVQGLRRAAWGDVPVVAMETRGAHSLNAAVKAGDGHVTRDHQVEVLRREAPGGAGVWRPALAARVHSGVLRRPAGGREAGGERWGGPVVVVVVCGGNNITSAAAEAEQQQLGLPGGGHQAGPA
uniref:L-serine ammonia-lyase n=1 Tax=Takifugu rubripes TaxID=31033 RepID=H2TBN3_TAKRU